MSIQLTILIDNLNRVIRDAQFFHMNGKLRATCSFCNLRIEINNSILFTSNNPNQSIDYIEKCIDDHQDACIPFIQGHNIDFGTQPQAIVQGRKVTWEKEQAVVNSRPYQRKFDLG